MQKRREMLLNKVKSLSVQIVCTDSAGRGVHLQNGYFYLGARGEPLILTTAHVLGWGGAEKYHARFDDDSGAPHDVVLELHKCGNVHLTRQAFAPQAHEYSVDLAVFRCDFDSSKLAPPLHPGVATVDDPACVMAYTGEKRVQTFSDGVITNNFLEFSTVSATLDDCCSGAAVVNARGQFVGIVLKGTAIGDARFISSSAVHAFLLSGEPRLHGLMDV